MNKKLNFYYFGEIGNYDEYNPAFVLKTSYAPEIVYFIAANPPFLVTKHDIANSLKIDLEKVESILNRLHRINAITIKENTYSLNFAVFLEHDVIVLKDYLSNVGEQIGMKILELKDRITEKVSLLKCANYYHQSRILYHLICDQVFDGTAFEFLASNGVLTSFKEQPGSRDYLIFGYEDSEIIDQYSKKLLCSSNNYQVDGYVFNSFGDSNGDRKDWYRFFRILDKGVAHVSSFERINLRYLDVLNDFNQQFAVKCGRIVKRISEQQIKFDVLMDEDKKMVHFLIEMEQVTIDKDNELKVNCPLFYTSEQSIINEISDLILHTIYPLVKATFESFEHQLSHLTALKHQVSVQDVANEVWHQMFGAANEYLVKVGFVERPLDIIGEGRYLKSMIIND